MAYRALYRTWRPARFDEVSGQPHIVKVLTGQIENNRIAHAYLFSGPRGTGKTSLAKIFARAVNCVSRQGAEPCGKCGVCAQARDDSSIDIVEIDAASNNGVDSVRDLRDRVNLLPAAGKYKVYIIDEVHMLSKGAFNALLKTLEEPPSHVIFILATTEPHKLPPTILSRCQRFDFRRISAEDIAARLKNVAEAEGCPFESDALFAIARAAEGGMRDALSILDQCMSFGEVNAANVAAALGSGDLEHVRLLIRAIAEYDEKKALERLSALLWSGADTHALIKSLADAVRRMMWLSAGAGTAGDNQLEDCAKKLGKTACIRALNILIQKEYEMRQNLRADIVLETAVMDIMCPEDDPNAADLLRIEKLEARLLALERQRQEQYIAPDNSKAPEKTAEVKQQKNTAKKKPEAASKSDESGADKRDAGELLGKMLDALKKDAYPIYLHAAKAYSAAKHDGVLEIQFGKDAALSAEYLQQPSVQKTIASLLAKILYEPVSVRVITENAEDKKQADTGIYALFGDNDIEKV
ncbi:MAG: DNA polymerase III subunit gamma/tau [Christensenellales bacterium]